MKKQKFLFIPFVLSLGIGLYSCNFGNGGNTQTFQNTVAVVDYRVDMGGPVMSTLWGVLAAPSLTDVNAGDCIYLYQFYIDYDNQPSSQFWTATGIIKEDVDQKSITITSDTITLGDYTLPISSITTVLANEFFQGRIFTGINCKDKNPTFRLLVNPDEKGTGQIKNFYLQAKPSSTTENSSDVAAVQAFNLLYYIQQYGRDTTRTISGSSDQVNFKYIKANLKYVSGVTDGTPTYSTVSNTSSPMEIYLFQ